ncbi:MAG: SGNH/GDSL hydrolase family protein [Planctomycetota bacterium]
MPSLTRLLHRLLVAAAAAISGTAYAGSYTDLFVFGDSLSDVGNTDNATLGFVPGSDNFAGRFSNGPVYAERLSAGLGFGTLRADSDGGDNFAYGGAETDGPGGFNGLFLNSLVEQVDAYLGRLGSTPADADALHVVFIGANDLLDGSTDTATPANVVSNQLQRLVNAGARQFLGINLPLLGLTPRFNGNASQSATRSATARQYNDALEDVFESIETNNAGTTIHRLDVQPLFG